MKKRALIGVVVVLALAATASLVWANGGLVSYWPFDEGSGSTASDVVSGNDGTLSGGRFGNALQFDGAGDSVNVGAISVGFGHFTAEGFVKTTQLEPYRNVVIAWPSSGSFNTSPGWSLQVHDGLPRATLSDGTGSHRIDLYGSSVINDGAWHHIAVVRDSTHVRLFADGAQVDSALVGALGSVDNSPNVVTISNSIIALDGRIDEVRISNTARYMGAYAVPTSQLGTDANTLGLWHLDDSVGSTASDASGNGKDGTLMGDSTWAGPTWSGDVVSPIIGGSNSLWFDGVDDYAQVDNDPTLEPSEVTLAAWLKSSSPGSPTSYRYIVHKGGKFCSAASYAFYTGGSGGLYFYIFNGSTYKLSPGPLASLIWNGEWHHVVGTYDGSAVRLYVDGSEIGSGTSTTIGIGYGLPDTNDFFVGTYGGTCPTIPTHFNGLIDEVGIWNRALTADEVFALSLGVGSLEWLPPIALLDWTLNENATLPIKFQLYDAIGDLICADVGPTLEVTSGDLELRFDSTDCYYIANLRPTQSGDDTAVVSLDGVELGSHDFEVVEPGKANGRGRGNN